VRVHPGQSDSGVGGEVTQAAGGGVAVHPPPAGVEQDRPEITPGEGSVDCTADRRW
jgi:hypothetical protein